MVQAITAFFDGFLAGLTPNPKLVAYLEPTPKPQQLPQWEPEELTPVERETIAVAETVAPQMSRTDLVFALLDEAWTQGITTYPKLIDYVKAATGEGCSRRVIADWKRKRKLQDGDVAA